MGFIKENFVTILLAFLILIIMLGFGFFVYKVARVYDDNNIDSTKIPESIDNNSDVEDQEDTKEIIESITVDKKDTQINESTLGKIANIFYNCNVSKKIRSLGYIVDAIATENKITVLSSGDGLSFDIEFILDNNILYTDIMYNESNPEINVIEVTLAVILVDCVGQVKGYPDGTLAKALGDEAAINYTIENEGVEIKKLDNGKGITVKVDLNSNFPFLDI